jgi:hypothetical protein
MDLIETEHDYETRRFVSLDKRYVALPQKDNP